MICNVKFKKGAVNLKVLLWILSFGFEAMPHPSYYRISVMVKTHHGPVIGLLSVQLQQFF